jgi:hypothetical protein
VRVLAALAAVLALVLASTRLQVPCLVVQDREQKEVAFFPLWGKDATFDISFLHSVARRPVVESFRRGPADRIVLFRTTYQGLGAGLPFGEEGGTVSVRNGWITLEGIHRELPRLVILPLPLTEHRLRVRGRPVDLLGLLGGRGPATLSIQRKSIEKIIEGRL